MNIQKALG